MTNLQLQSLSFNFFWIKGGMLEIKPDSLNLTILNLTQLCLLYFMPTRVCYVWSKFMIFFTANHLEKLSHVVTLCDVIETCTICTRRVSRWKLAITLQAPCVYVRNGAQSNYKFCSCRFLIKSFWVFISIEIVTGSRPDVTITYVFVKSESWPALW